MQLLTIILFASSALAIDRYCRKEVIRSGVRGCTAAGARCCSQTWGGVYNEFTSVTSLGTVDSPTNLSGTSNCDGGAGTLVCVNQNK